MKRRKSALVVSENPILNLELRRMLNVLHIQTVFDAQDFESAIEIAESEKPTFTFIDADSNSKMVQELGVHLKSEVRTHMVFLKKKGTFRNNEGKSISILEKPITLNRLNDFINPSLSFAALIEEARKLIEQESANTAFQL